MPLFSFANIGLDGFSNFLIELLDYQISASEILLPGEIIEVFSTANMTNYGKPKTRQIKAA